MSKKRPSKRRKPKKKPVPEARHCRHRRIIPGTTYLITKKCTDDRFWLLPDDPIIGEILLYTLIIKALAHGVLIHGFVAASNHIHLVATDVRGELPNFMKYFLGESSKAIQVARGVKRRPIWDKERYSAVTLLDLDAAERKIAYAILNPPEGGTCEPMDWPGLISCRWRLGETMVATRPPVYFSGRRPEVVSMRLSPVAAQYMEKLPDNATEEEKAQRQLAEDEANASSNARIEKMVSEGLERIRAERAKQGKSFLGAERMLELASVEDRGNRPFGEINPLFATRNSELMAWAILDYKSFEAKHRDARERYLHGETDVVFPYGTFGHRVTLGVHVAEGRAAA